MQAMHKGRMSGFMAGLICAVGMAGAASAEVKTEVAKLGKSVITLHVQDFLTPDDLVLLRLVSTDKAALKLFVPDASGFAAVAASPKDGFTKGGALATSATALGGFSDSASAVSETIAACQLATKAKAECVIILEIAPAG